MQIIILTVLNSYIKSLLAGTFWHGSELKSTCNIQITHFCSAKRLIFNISSSPHPRLVQKRSWYHIDQKVKSNILWKNPNRLFGQPGISSIGKFSGFVTADLLWWLVAGPWIRRRGPSSSSWSSVSQSSTQPWGPTSDSAVAVPVPGGGCPRACLGPVLDAVLRHATPQKHIRLPEHRALGML